MIVGNGLLASAFSKFKESNDIIIFASGVSDSTCIDYSAFKREENLIRRTIETHSDKKFVYFSTTSIESSDELPRLYVKHKIAMENLIKNNSDNHCIFRLTNVIGQKGNSNTIFRFLLNKIREEKPFDLWIKAYRNLVDIEDIVKVLNYLLSNRMNELKNCTINIGNTQNYWVLDIAKAISIRLNKKLIFNEIDKGGNSIVELKKITALYPNYSSLFAENYLEKLIEKYIEL